jgi:glutamate synthase (NADPH/NADH)
MDDYLKGVSSKNVSPNEEIESVDEVLDIGEAPFLEMAFPISAPGLPSSQPSSASALASSTATATLRAPSTVSQGLEFVGAPHIGSDSSHISRFAAVRSSLDWSECRCGGLRNICCTFKTPEQALLAQSILLGDHSHIIDPLIIRDGDIFAMTVEEYEKLCCKQANRDHLRLYRAPLSFTPSSSSSSSSQALPLDPYYLGLWLGDGATSSTGISSSDREVAVWMQSYVDRLNKVRPQGARSLRLTRSRRYAAGIVMRNGYVANSDVFEYHVVSPPSTRGYYWNPVLSGLHELGLIDDKSHGIPPAYMEADEAIRLAVIAGLIDSDGAYVKSHNSYRFIQMTEGHRKIVYDLKQLAESCDISVTGVDKETRPPSFGGNDPHQPVHIIYLGKGSEKFQKYLLFPRKKMDLNRKFYTHDARPFEVLDAPDGEYRAIEVSGGEFQLANRMVMCNCHL